MENKEKQCNTMSIHDTLKYAKMTGAKIYSSKEKEKANIVVNDFKDIAPHPTKSHICKHFADEDLLQMFYTCINAYAIFDDDFLINKINDYLINTPIIDGGHSDDSLFQVLYKPILKNNEIIKMPASIIIPSDFNIKTAGHYLVNIIANILKNCNVQEEKLFMTYNNVIPILLEMISAYESSPIETKEVFRKKQDFILKTIKIYNILIEYAPKNPNQDLDEQNLIIATAGQYLTSFYYALGLFYEYLQKPYSILEDIDDVLDCEATTLNVIEEHMDKDSDEKYQKGLAKFKKLII